MDDTLVTGNSNEEVQSLIRDLNKQFVLKDRGVIDYFLRIQVKHTIEGMHLSQTM